MASFWKNLVDSFRSPAHEMVFEPRPIPSAYPRTYQPEEEDAGESAPPIFEPALLQFSRAFRNGEPRFENSENARYWYEVRRRVIDHLLGIVVDSQWNEHLVLRGSLLLKPWYEEAREPGDIDWVFRPANIAGDDPFAAEFFEHLIKSVSENPNLGIIHFESDKIAVDNIWTYERAAGKRIVFPWRADGLPPGIVQIDIVFNEPLQNSPIQTPVKISDDNGRLLWTADKELSLAWKLLWLETDIYPQGKDLYDAVLLAERTYLPLELLERVFRAGDWRPSNEKLTAEFPLRWKIDWANFQLEYPWVEGEAKEWQSRLSRALITTFERAES